MFARHAKEPALHHVGEVRAASPRDAEVFAYAMYDERKWVEMFVVLRAHIATAIASRPPAGAGDLGLDAVDASGPPP